MLNNETQKQRKNTMKNNRFNSNQNDRNTNGRAYLVDVLSLNNFKFGDYFDTYIPLSLK